MGPKRRVFPRIFECRRRLIFQHESRNATSSAHLRGFPRFLGIEGSSSPLLRAPAVEVLAFRARRWCSGCEGVSAKRSEACNEQGWLVIQWHISRAFARTVLTIHSSCTPDGLTMSGFSNFLGPATFFSSPNT